MSGQWDVIGLLAAVAAAVGSLITIMVRAASDYLAAKSKVNREEREVIDKVRAEERKEQAAQAWLIVERQEKHIERQQEQIRELQSTIGEMAEAFHEEASACEVEVAELYVWLQHFRDVAVRAAAGKKPMEIQELPPRKQREAGRKVEFLKRTSEQTTANMERISEQLKTPFPGTIKPVQPEEQP